MDRAPVGPAEPTGTLLGALQSSRLLATQECAGARRAALQEVSAVAGWKMDGAAGDDATAIAGTLVTTLRTHVIASSVIAVNLMCGVLAFISCNKPDN